MQTKHKFFFFQKKLVQDHVFHPRRPCRRRKREAGQDRHRAGHHREEAQPDGDGNRFKY
jgi:hypothetical protein